MSLVFDLYVRLTVTFHVRFLTPTVYPTTYGWVLKYAECLLGVVWVYHAARKRVQEVISL